VVVVEWIWVVAPVAVAYYKELLTSQKVFILLLLVPVDTEHRPVTHQEQTAPDRTPDLINLL
jgi:hypothetical protein|tara:strand:- start:738 stop:923 length:186 start_codon:yes stop_codon:yes gene_type:complete